MRAVLTGAFVALILFLLELEAVDFVGGGVAGLALLVALIGAGILLVRAAATRRRGPALFAAGVLAASALAFGGGALVGRYQQRVSQERGDRIARALDAHRTRTGAYPETLQALVPRELERVPPTAMGLVRSFEYGYRARGADAYDLRFLAVAWTGLRRGPEGGWSWFD